MSLTEVFKTVVMLSCTGSVAVIMLLFLKPFSLKKISAGWQVFLWLIALLCMIVPLWRLIPKETVPRFSEVDISEAEFNFVEEELPQTEPKIKIDPAESAALIWLLGVCIFLASALCSYAVFLIKKRRSSIELKESAAFSEVKKELGIKRGVKIRISDDLSPPMLAGVVRPVIYIPRREFKECEERMIFYHELTHYKRGDLVFKWFALFVNALHWFNPLAYFLSKNINQACEIACDAEVIKSMSDKEKRLYMNMILELAEKRKAGKKCS